MTSPHEGGGEEKPGGDRGPVTYGGKPAGEERDLTSPIEGLLSRPPAPEHRCQEWELTPKGGWGAQR